jgi:hypothetical protein
VGHVGQEVGTLLVGNVTETLVVPVTGVGRGTADEQAGLEQVGVAGETLVVEDTGLGYYLVRERLEVDGRSGDLLLGGVVTVGEVTTVREAETHDTVLGVDERGERGKVGSGTRVRLDVDTPDGRVEVEGLERALTAEVLENVNVLVTTVVAGTGETLGVLVGEDGTVGLEHGERRQVLCGVSACTAARLQPSHLGSNQLETGELAPGLILDDLLDLGVGLGERSVETLVLRGNVSAAGHCTGRRTKSVGMGTDEDILIA